MESSILPGNANPSPEPIVIQAVDPPGWGKTFMDRLTPEDRNALAACVQWEQYPAGADIVREDETGDDLFIVATGRVVVKKDRDNGASTLLAYRGPGEIIGEMGAMGNRIRCATVSALQDSALLRINRQCFNSLLTRHPSINRALLQVLIDRLQAADVARITVAREEQHLASRLEKMATEADRLAELAHLRQETIELIVHDLRNPLGVIEGCLDLLQLSTPQPSLDSQTEIFGIARTSLQRLLSLVEGILETSAFDEPSLTLARQPVELARLLHSASESVQVTARKYNITLVVELPLDLPCPLGDPALLERLVVNLLDNAVAYTPERGRIVLSAGRAEGEVRVCVTDTGPGVPADQREHIFERFGRASNGRGRKRGFGLGLYFCRQVAQAHGGRIWVEPGPGGVGSRFIFTLPV